MNKLAKKLLSLLLSISMMVSLASFVSAEDLPTFSMSLDKTEAKPGDIIYATIRMDGTLENVESLGFYICFDPDVFSRGADEKALDIVGDACSETFNGGTRLSNNVIYEDMKGIQVPGTPHGAEIHTGVLRSVAFKVKEDLDVSENITTKMAFYFRNGSLSYVGGGSPENGNGFVSRDETFTITIKAEGSEEPPVSSGYTVTMPDDKTAVVGETVEIPVKVGSGDDTVTEFNAVDMQFSYDKNILELTSTELSGYTVTPGEGTVRVQGYGESKNVDTNAFALSFKVIASGEGTVSVTSAKVDNSGHAIAADAPEAAVLKETTKINASAYAVSLSDDFTGESTAVPGQDYTFTAKDSNYTYSVTATSNGTEIPVTDNQDGTFTIAAENITGNLVITDTKTPKSYAVTVSGTGAEDVSGAETATYLTDYAFTVTQDPLYTYEVSVTIGGAAYTGFSVSEGTYTIPGADITGAISVTVIKTEIPVQNWTVTFDGEGAGDADGDTTVSNGSSYSFSITKAEGYEYSVSAKMGGNDVEVAEADGSYTIENVTGDLVITISKTAEIKVEVYEFVQLSGKTMYLIVAEGTPVNQTFAYDGNAMYYSEAYKGYAYLSVEESTLTKEAAAAKVGQTTADKVTLAGTCDVNMTGVVDINDVQLTYDMYNAKYSDFNTVSVQKFLNADINSDHKIDVEDCAAVVAAIN